MLYCKRDSKCWNFLFHGRFWQRRLHKGVCVFVSAECIGAAAQFKPSRHPPLATPLRSASSLNDLVLPRPHSATASNLNGSKWRPPACQAPATQCSFQLHRSNHFAANKRPLIHQIPHLLLPTPQRDAVIFTSTLHVCNWEFAFLFLVARVILLDS